MEINPQSPTIMWTARGTLTDGFRFSPVYAPERVYTATAYEVHYAHDGSAWTCHSIEITGVTLTSSRTKRVTFTYAADTTPAEVRALADAARPAPDQSGRDDALEAAIDAARNAVPSRQAAPIKPCPGSDTAVSRWYAPHGWVYTDAADIPDPGPYTVGERVPCPTCRADTPVARVKTTERETGRQYVAWPAAH